MKFEYDGEFYYLVFPDGIKFKADRDLWMRLMKLKESSGVL